MKRTLFFLLFLGIGIPCFAVTEWSTGGEKTGGTITDGLKISSAGDITVSGTHDVSGVAGEESAILFQGAGKITISGTLNVTGGLNFYAKTQLDVLEGATFNVVAPADTSGCKIRVSRTGTIDTTAVEQTTVNWAGNGVWNTTGGGNSLFFSATNQPAGDIRAQYNITGGSLEIQSRNTAIAFCGTTEWNISGGTLKVGAGNDAVTFGGGEWSVGTHAGTIRLSGSGKMEIAGSGNFMIGGSTEQCGPLTINLGAGSTLASSRSFTTSGLATVTRVMNLDGGTFQATDTISFSKDISTNLTKNGATFQVNEGKTLTFNAALSCADTTNDVNRVVTKTGTGTLVLAADNSNATTGLLAGDKFDVQAGTLSFSAVNRLGSAGIQLHDEGTLLATQTATLSNVLTFGNVGNISTKSGVTLTLSTAINATSDSTLVKAGAGFLSMNMENGFVGDTVVTGGFDADTQTYNGGLILATNNTIATAKQGSYILTDSQLRIAAANPYGLAAYYSDKISLTRSNLDMRGTAQANTPALFLEDSTLTSSGAGGTYCNAFLNGKVTVTGGVSTISASKIAFRSDAAAAIFVDGVNQGGIFSIAEGATLNLASELLTFGTTATSLRKQGTGRMVFTGTISTTVAIDRATHSLKVEAGEFQLGDYNPLTQLGGEKGSLESVNFTTVETLAGTTFAFARATDYTHSKDTTNNGTLVNRNADHAVTLSGILSGTGTLEGDFILAGAQENTGDITVAEGTVTLAKTSGAAAKNVTVVPGGRLLINDAQALSGTLEMTGGKVKIADGATFAHDLTVNGTTVDTVSDLAGTLEGDIFVTQGKFSPGNSIGTIHQTGNTDFDSDTTLLIEISSPSSYDVFMTTGNVNFDTGAEIEFDAELSPYLQGITFLQASSYTINGAAVPVGFDWNTLLADSYHWNLTMDGSGNLTAFIDGSTVPEPGTVWLLLLSLTFLNRLGKRER